VRGGAPSRAGGVSAGEIKTRAAEARAWLLDAAFPLWAGAGFDARTGLFHEKLDAHGKPVAGNRRARVQSRQTYVFVEAGRMGWTGPWRERVEAGLAVLLGPLRAEGGAIGAALDDNGKLIDPRRDLYDQAFGLFALAHARTIDPARADPRIAELFTYLGTQTLAPGGFAQGDLKPKPRGQNPHMHLFEAAMALTEQGVAPGESLARDMCNLFESYFYDPRHGALGEYYNDDWTPLSGEEGRICEPGHHCEWIWLLDRWRKISGADNNARADALWDHAMRHGQNGPVLIYETYREGGARNRRARLWAQTEHLKAALVRFERGVGGAGDVVKAYDGLALYYEGCRDGLWLDWRNEDGTMVQEPSPASSFYHIVLAYSELLRVAAAL
jgi:mannose-6-phosphate isomerase